MTTSPICHPTDTNLAEQTLDIHSQVFLRRSNMVAPAINVGSTSMPKLGDEATNDSSATCVT